MAKIVRPLVARLRPNKDSDIEEIKFEAGDEVKLIKTWEHFYLVKDAQGHFYNLPHADVTI